MTAIDRPFGDSRVRHGQLRISRNRRRRTLRHAGGESGASKRHPDETEASVNEVSPIDA